MKSESGVEGLIRAWFAKQEGFFGISGGVEDVSTGEVTGEGDPLFDGAVNVRELATVIEGWFAKPPA